MAEEKAKVDMKGMLISLQEDKNVLKRTYSPIFEKDREVSKAFQDFDKSIEDRIKEIGQ